MVVDWLIHWSNDQSIIPIDSGMHSVVQTSMMYNSSCLSQTQNMMFLPLTVLPISPQSRVSRYRVYKYEHVTDLLAVCEPVRTILLFNKTCSADPYHSMSCLCVYLRTEKSENRSSCVWTSHRYRKFCIKDTVFTHVLWVFSSIKLLLCKARIWIWEYENMRISIQEVCIWCTFSLFFFSFHQT